MKYIINEKQYKLLTENNDGILDIPFEIFDNDWDLLQKFLKKRGNPPYNLSGNLQFEGGSEIDTLGSIVSIDGCINLTNGSINSLGNLTYVSEFMNLFRTKIPSLENLTKVGWYLDLFGTDLNSIGNLTYVGEDLDLVKTNVDSLGNLKNVGGSLYLRQCPLSKKYSELEIRQMVEVADDVILS